MCFLMIRQPPRTTRTDTLVPYTTLFRSELDYNGERRVVTGSGDGAISAFVAALDVPVRIMDYHEHAIGTGTDTRAASYVELRVGDSATGFGVGIDRDIVTAPFQAVLSAVNRHLANGVAVATEHQPVQATGSASQTQNPPLQNG